VLPVLSKARIVLRERNIFIHKTPGIDPTTKKVMFGDITTPLDCKALGFLASDVIVVHCDLAKAFTPVHWALHEIRQKRRTG
jgi:hypothetical protein